MKVAKVMPQYGTERTPLVSILLPVHKDNPYLRESIQSLLSQTFQNFEVLFLDNSDLGIPESIWKLNPKIIYERLPRSFGLSESLNAGIRISHARYVARMDFDDIAKRNRLELQVNYLQSHPEVSILGGGIDVIGNDLDANVRVGDVILRSIEAEDMQEYLLFKNPIFHPTVIMKREDLLNNNLFYNKKYDAAEDLDLWMRASHKLVLANLNEVVLSYRLHSNQFSREDGLNSQFQAAKIRIRHASWMIFHRPQYAFKAIKVVHKNIKILLKLLPAHKNRRVFNKFA